MSAVKTVDLLAAAVAGKVLAHETFSAGTFGYVQWASRESRKAGEKALRGAGWVPNRGYPSGVTSEVLLDPCAEAGCECVVRPHPYVEPAPLWDERRFQQKQVERTMAELKDSIENAAQHLERTARELRQHAQREQPPLEIARRVQHDVAWAVPNLNVDTIVQRAAEAEAALRRVEELKLQEATAAEMGVKTGKLCELCLENVEKLRPADGKRRAR